MPYGKMIKQSFQLLWNYKVLWIFATILTLMGGRGCSMGSFSIELPYVPTLPSIHFTSEILIWVVIAVLLVVGVVWRYISETAIIKMSDHYLITGEKLSLKEGVALGKSSSARTIFKLDFTIAGILAMLYSPLIILIYFIVEQWNPSSAEKLFSSNLMGWTAALILIACIFSFILTLLALLPVLYIAHRAIVFEKLSVKQALKRTKVIIAQNFQDLFISIVIQSGIGTLLGMVPAIVLFFVLIIGLLFSGGAVSLADLLFRGSLNEVGDVLGYVLFLVMIFLFTLLPLSFIRGWIEIFYSSYWTLFYREVLKKENNRQSFIEEI